MGRGQWAMGTQGCLRGSEAGSIGAYVGNKIKLYMTLSQVGYVSYVGLCCVCVVLFF